MIAKFLIFITTLMSFGGALIGAPQESLIIQEMRLAIDYIRDKLSAQNVDLNIFQERLLSLENSLSSFKQDLKIVTSEKPLEKRLTLLEKAHEMLIADFKMLKNHLTDTNGALAQCQLQLAKIDKQLSSDIQTLKNSLNAMLALLQAPPQNLYIVQTGDSLGKIAIDHKTDIKTLKKLNNLATDIIYSGQKLLLP